MNRIMRTVLASAAASLAIVATSAEARVIYTTPVTTPGNQGYGDNLGLDFTVNSTIKVNGLGAFDAGANGIGSDILVGIYDLTNSVYVTPVLNFNGYSATVGSYAFRSISTVTLGPGSYSIVATGFNGSDLNFNTNFPGFTNGASPISFDNFGGALTNGFSRYGGGAAPGTGTVFPYQSAFAGGTFSVVPEPAVWGMMILGFGVVGAGMRVRARKALVAA